MRFYISARRSQCFSPPRCSPSVLRPLCGAEKRVKKLKKFTVSETTSLKNFTDCVYPQGSFAFRRLLRDRDIRINGEKTAPDLLPDKEDPILKEVCSLRERLYELEDRLEKIAAREKPSDGAPQER